VKKTEKKVEKKADKAEKKTEEKAEKAEKVCAPSVDTLS
jgi:hypothetical protein